jgi:flagellar hook-associated protein 3 FlgL
MVARISTFALYNAINGNNLALQSKYGETQSQISSGLKSVDYKGIAESSNTLLALQTDLSETEAYLDNITLAQNKYNTMLATIGLLQDRAESFRVDIAASMGTPSDPGTDGAFVATAQADYDDFVGALNSQFSGDYIFSGTASNILPVDITDPGYVGVVTPPSAANFNYYQGNTADQTVPIGNNLSVDTTINAADPAIEQALRAFRLIIDNPGDSVARTEALGLIDQALDGLNIMYSDVAANLTTTDRQEELLSEQQSIVKNTISDIRDVDLAEASLRSEALAAQLQASYTVSSKAFQISLIDYLR